MPGRTCTSQMPRPGCQRDRVGNGVSFFGTRTCQRKKKIVSTSGRTVKKVESKGVRNDDAAAAPEIRCEDPGAAGGHKQDRRRLVIYTDAGARTAAAPG